MTSNEGKHSELAMFGGTAIVPEHKWPVWPIATQSDIAYIRQVLESGTWSISGDSTGRQRLCERDFAQQFSSFLDVAYCIPTANGSSALVSAMEALDIGCGDEVIVPGLTWVATASAIVHVNAIPVMADVELDTLCVSPHQVESLIGKRTAAIIAVHLYGSMADVSLLRTIADKHHLLFLEDCSHVHGARWQGKSAGAFGQCGTFSMQQSKVLTCGEGGAVVTNDPTLAERLEQLRADGRILSTGDSDDGGQVLIDKGVVLGTNFAMSEIHAALLLAQLRRLPAQNQKRLEGARYLDDRLRSVPGVKPQCTSESQDLRVFYKYALRCSPEYFGGLCAEEIAAMTAAELGIQVSPVYRPLNQHPLYTPQTKRRLRISECHWNRLNPAHFCLPHAERAYREYITLPHNVLLAEPEQLDCVAEALIKVQAHSSGYRSLAGGR